APAPAVGHGPGAGAAPGFDAARPHRARDLDRHRGAAGPRGGGPPRHRDRPRGRGPGRARTVGPDLLDRPHAHAGVRRHAEAPAHHRLRDVAPARDAGAHAGGLSDGRHRAARARRHAGGAGGRLRAHGAREGAAGAARDPQARAQERGAAGRHAHRAAVRPAAGRRHRLRDDLRVAGRGPAAHLRHQQPRLPAGGSRGLRHRHGVRRCQPARRSLLRLARPAHQRPLVIRRLPPGLWLAMVPLAAAVVCAVFAPQLAPHDPLTGDLSARLRPPTWMDAGSRAHPLGTDQLGRDILSRVIYGARVSLLVGLVSSLIGGTVGVTLGVVSGYFRGRVDTVIAKLIDIQLAFPFILFAITVIAVLGPSLRNLLVILAVSGWVTYARVVRGQTLSLREHDFIQAARGLGCPAWRIVARHVVPNVLPYALV